MVGAGLEPCSGLDAIGQSGSNVEPDAELERAGGVECGFELEGLEGIPIGIRHFDADAGAATEG